MEKTERFLDAVKNIITTKDYDWIDVIVGPEGVGKTCLAAGKCKYVYPDFDIGRDAYFNVHDLRRAIKNSQPGQAILADEGSLIFFARSAMSNDGKIGMNLLTTMRMFNVYLAVCIPNFWVLEKYIREHRVKTLSRVVKRGWYWHFGPRKVKMIHRDKTTFNSYRTVWPDFDFRDTFPNYKANNPEEWSRYERKKAAASTEGKGHSETCFPMHCKKCGHDWLYTGNLKQAQCPSCRTYIIVPDIEEKYKSQKEQDNHDLL